MASDRITRVRVEGLRVLDRVMLDVRGMNVLIGENGSGKSTLLEALELLRRASSGGHYADAVLGTEHGPVQELVRLGTDRMTLGVRVEGDGAAIEYAFTAALAGTSCVISEEHLDVYQRPAPAEPLHALLRTPEKTLWFNQEKGRLEPVPTVPPHALAAPSAAQGLVSQDAAVRLRRALEGIEVHPPFDVRPLWQQQEQQVRRGPRWPARPSATSRVERFGYDLPAAFAVLRNDREKWERLIARARAAVGAELTDIVLDPAGGGQLDIGLRFGPSQKLPLHCLSEGQVSFLALLAVAELDSGRTLLALDEPDVHFHPELVANLVKILEELSSDCPVVIATHSDRLLDALEDPAASALLCELEPSGAASLRRPNPAALDRWLDRYRGLGSISAAGYARHVFDEGPPAGRGIAS